PFDPPAPHSPPHAPQPRGFALFEQLTASLALGFAASRPLTGARHHNNGSIVSSVVLIVLWGVATVR
ncbi:hypothetical protein, partial [Halorubrum sp. CBA1125]|uniref:hypothetical protein n=1 Tax=Halorubrum sp. CBA1125 TaxID=2668072 RepID=UPI001E5ACFA5